MKTSKMTKRWLAFLMMIVMVLTSQPVTSLADTVVGIVNRGPDESETALPADTVRKNVVTFEIAEGAKVTVNGTEIPDGGTAEAEDGTLLYVVEPEEGYQISEVKEILAEEEIPGRLNERRDDEGNLIENTTEYIIEEITTDEIIVRVSAEPAADVLSDTGAAEIQTEAPADELQTETEAAGSEEQTETAMTEGVTETNVTELQTEAAETEAVETEVQTEAVTEAAETEVQTEAAEIETETEAQTEAVTEAAETEVQSEAVTEAAETEVQTEAMTEAVETEVQTEAETEAAETEAQTEAVTEAVETEVQTEAMTEAAETETQTEAVTEAVETEAQTEIVTEAAETEAQTEIVTEAAETEAQTEAETEEIIDEPEGVSEAVVLEAQTADGKIVKLSAPEGAFTVPASEVTMTADPLTAEQEAAIVEQLTAMAEADGMMLTDYVAYDINLWVNGEIVQPLVPVQVTFENVDMTAGEAADETPGGTTEEIFADDAPEIEAVGFQMDTDTMELSDVNEKIVAGDETSEDTTVGVEVEHFTPTGYALMSNNGTALMANNQSYRLQIEQESSEKAGMLRFKVTVTRREWPAAAANALTLTPSVVIGSSNRSTDVSVFYSDEILRNGVKNPQQIEQNKTWIEYFEISESDFEKIQNQNAKFQVVLKYTNYNREQELTERLAIKKAGKKPSMLGSSSGVIEYRDTFTHKKKIDYLGDGTPNSESGLDSQADKEDLYRLYLDMTGDSKPIDLLIVVDKSGSMNDSTNSESASTTRKEAISRLLNGYNGSEGLIKKFLTANEQNELAIVSFSGWSGNGDSTGGTNYSWKNDTGVITSWTSDSNYQYTAPNCSGGTNYEAGLYQADELLNRRSDDGKKHIMIFISDGAPTHYLQPDGDYTNGYKRAGTGGEGNDNVKECRDQMTGNNTSGKNGSGYWANNVFKAAHSDLTIYTVSMNMKSNTEVLSDLKTADGSYVNVNSSSELIENIEQILFPTGVQIQDTLSAYVDFYDPANVLVKMKDASGNETTLYQNKQITSEGTDKLESVVCEGNKITVTFKEKYGLEKGCVYTLSYNVKLTDTAKEEYKESGYNNTGDPDTDYPGNATSSNKDGFHSNENAVVSYKVPGSDQRKEESYDHPVVQTHAPRKTSGQADQIVGIGSEITYEIEYVNYKGRGTVVVIEDTLSPGLTYKEGSADPAEGFTYDEATRTLRWEISNAPHNERRKVSFTATVNENAITTDKLTNTASVEVGTNPKVWTNEIENPVVKKEEIAPGAGEAVQQGEEITYRVYWENAHDQAATVTVTDALDPGVDYKEGSASVHYEDGSIPSVQPSESDHTLTWTIPNVPTGTRGYVEFTVTVNEKAFTDEGVTESGIFKLDDGKVLNQANVQVGSDPAVNTDIVENPVAAPEITIQKWQQIGGGAETQDLQQVEAGDVVTYTLKIKNTGSGTAAGVTVQDVIPDGLTLVEGSISDGGVIGADRKTITWNLGDMAANAEKTVSFRVTVPKVKESTTWTNVGQVKFDNDPDEPENPSNPWKESNEVEIKEDIPVISIEKEQQVTGKDRTKAEQWVGENDEVTYYLTVKNTGNASAKDIEVKDVLPAGLTDGNGLTLVVDSIKPAGTYDAETRMITWKLDELAAGDTVELSFRVKVPAEAQVNTWTNTGWVKYGNNPNEPDEPDDPDTSWDPWTQSNDVVVKENFVPPVKTETDPGQNKMVQPGDEITYEITWENYNAETAAVKITDKLDAGVDFASADNGGVYDAASHTVTWTFADQPAGEKGTVTLIVKVNENAKTAGEVNNQASVKVGNRPEIKTDIIPNPTPNPEKTEVTPGENRLVRVGDELTYEITWRNYQEGTATVVITDPLDAGVDFVSADNGGAYDEAAHTVTWTLADQAAGAEGKVTLTVRVNTKATPAGEVNNQAYVQVGDDPAVDTKIIPNPTPKTEKKEVTPGKDELVRVGDEITYEITWRNYEEQAADVVITDRLDDGVDFVNADNGGVYDAGTHTVIWTLANRAAGAEGKVTLKVKVNADATPAGEVNNQASVKVGGNPAVDTEKIPNPTPKTEKKEVTPGENELVHVGEEITYEITWRNYQEGTATVVITDPLDAGVDFVDADNGGVYDAAAHAVTWTLENQEAGTEGTVTLKVKVNADATPVGEVNNQAHVQVGNDPAVDTKIIPNPTPKTAKEETTPGEDELVFVGDEITYEITWQNYEEQAADVVITDPLDAGVDFVSADNGGVYDEATHTVTWILKNQASGAEGKVTLTVQVNENATPAGEVNNQAHVKVGENMTVDTKIIPNPTPKQEKAEEIPGENVSVAVGDEITYEITWRNYQEQAADVIITDPLDNGVDFVEASDNGAYDKASHTVTWTFENQAAGKEGTVTLVVKVNADATPTGVVNNQAHVQVGNGPVVDTRIIPNPTPKTEKEEIAPGEDKLVFVGDEITYEITWQNYQSEAADVIVTDPLDDGVDFVSADNDGIYDAETHTVTWTIADQAAGAEGKVTLTVQVNANATLAGEVNNQASVKVGNNPAVDTKTIPNPTPKQEKEEVTPGENETVHVGEEITYEITWRNYQSEAADVVITDPLNAGVDFVSADNEGVYDKETHTVTWIFENQVAETEGKVTLKVKVNENATLVGEVKNQAGVQVGNDAEVKTRVIPNPTPKTEKTEVTPGENELVHVGDEITYHIAWRNDQEGTATVIITDPLDAGVDFVSADNGGAYDEGTHTVIWTFENQEAGAGGIVTLTVKVNADATPAGEVNNQAHVKVGNDPEVDTKIIPNPTPKTAKTETAPGEDELVRVGDEITYEITWKNYQEETATVVITDPLDAGVDFVSADNGGVYDRTGHTVTWTFENLAAGTEGTVTLKVRVNADATPAGEVNNQAHVQVGSDPVVDTRIIPNPTPKTEKEETSAPGEGGYVFVGDEITYEITWQNYEEQAADVVITDPLDAGVDFVGASENGAYDVETHTVTWTLAQQAAGAEGTVTLTVKVNENATPAGEVNNQAHVTVGDNPAVDTKIIPNPTPNPEKTEVTPDENRTVFVGDEITWRNYQEQAATVVITDPLDAGVDFVSADNGGVYDKANHTVTWTLAEQAAGAEGKVTLKVKVNADATPVGEVNNQAHVQVGNDPAVDTQIIPNPTPKAEKEEVTPGEGKYVFVGDELTYEITWQNYEEQAATVVITDLLDAGVDFVSASDGGVYDASTRTVTWTLADRAAGAEGKVTLSVKVNADATPAGEVNNQAHVQVGNNPIVDTKIIPNPTPNPEKTEVTPGEDETVFVGDEITYEITWRNYQEENATVVITDPLDAGVDYVSADNNGAYDGASHTVTWTLADQAAGAEGKVTLTVKVNADATPAGEVNNQAHVQVGNDPAVDTRIIPNPTPKTEKEETSNPGEGNYVFVGDELTYEITWKNYQEGNADVVITDPLDAGVDFVSASDNGAYDAANHTVTWTLTGQEAGAEGRVTLTVCVNTKATLAGEVNNQAHVQVDNDPTVDTKIIPNPTPNPEKTEVTPGENETVFVGDEITYEITWRNYQEETATVVITDPLDTGVDFVSADNGGVYDEANHTVTWTFAGQEAGAEGTVTLTVKVNENATPAGEVNNQAHVQVGNDPVVDTEIIPNPTPKTEKEETAPGEDELVRVGDEITYEITWQNYKEETATVVITDPLDAGVDFVSADNNGAYDEASHTVTWTFENQAAGAEGKVTLTVKVNADATPAGVVNNQAHIQVDNDPVVDTRIIPNPTPKTQKEETSNPGEGSYVFVGDEITYEITWRNYQEEAATVVITDPMDAGVDFVSADNGGVYDEASRTVTWTLAQQVAGAEGKVALTVKVNTNATPVGIVNNQASVKVGNGPDVKTKVIPNPTPKQEKEETTPGENESVVVGDEITYEITWRNYEEEAADVIITDPLDAGVDFVSADNNGAYDAASRTVTWTLAQQAAGAEGTVTLTVKVNENATPAGVVNNQAHVQVGNGPVVDTRIIPNPTPKTEKTEVTPGEDKLVFVGDEITYEITWQNYQSEAADVVITDPLDPGVDFVEASDGGVYDAASHTVTWTVENQAAGAEGEVMLTVKVNENATPVGIVNNQASVKVGNGPDVKTKVIPNPTPKQEKEEVTPGENELVHVGDEITYEITWRNYQTEAATVVITDPLDPGVDFVSADNNGSYDADAHTVTWTLADQAVGAEGKVTLVVQVNENATPAGKVENQAGVKVGNDAEVKTKIIPNPTPKTEKTEVTPGEDELVFVGDEITYHIAWRNYQEETVTVIITDPLDAGVDFVSADYDGVYDEANHTVTWTFEDQQAGTGGIVTLVVKVNADATPAGEVNNQAHVKVGNDSEVDTEIIPNPTPNPKKEEVTPGEDELVRVGDEITYEITWQNYKEETATVVITDPLDAGVDFVSASENGAYDAETHTVTWTLADQTAGAEGRVTLKVRVNADATPAGEVNNQAHVQVGNDPVVDTRIIPNPTPKTQKEETSNPGEDNYVFVGDELTYEITWQNYEEQAADVVITDPLDAGVDFVSADNNGVYDEASHTVTWTLAQQAAGAEGTVTLTVKVNADATPAGMVNNQAHVQVGNNPAVDTKIIPNPTPNPEKTEVTPGENETVFVGDEITYEITWKNYRTEAADVVITDPLDAGVDFVSADNNGVYDEANHTVTWTFAEQAAGAEGTVVLTVKVKADATPVGEVNNQAHVQVGNDPIVDTEIIPNPTPNPKKTETAPGKDELVRVGDEITYEITWKNYQEETATVVITDPLDKGVDFVSADHNGVHNEANHTVTWTFENQAAGAEGTVTLKVKVNADATPVGEVNNQAHVQVGNDPVVDTEIIPNPTPKTEKEEISDPGEGGYVFVGDEITYEITWQNYKEQAADVVITDPLDTGVDFVEASDGGAYDAATRSVTWTLADRATGAEGKVTLTVKVNADAKQAGIVNNQAHVQVGDDPAVDTKIIPNPTPNPEKTEVTPGENETVFVGDEITYEITWRNYRTEAADIIITDPLDAGVDFVSADNNGAYDAAGRTVTWTLADQAAGAEGRVTLKVKVNADATPAGEVNNQAHVKVGNDPAVDTEIIPNPTPNPEKTETTPGAEKYVFVGDEITYEITWRNYNEEAADVVITDPLDKGVDFVEADSNGTYNEATRTVTWTLENQAAGAEGRVTLKVKVNADAKAAGEVNNQAHVKVGNDPTVDTEIIPNPTPNPEKTEAAPGENEMVQPGDEITYRITWKNYQAEAATVTVTDPLDKNVEFVSADNNGTYDAAGHTVTWTFADAAAGTEGTVTLTVRVLESAETAGKVENQAGVKVGNDPTVDTEIIPNPTPKPEKTEVTPGENKMVQPGDEIAYEITWKNYQAEAANVVITDPLDANVEFVSADNSGAYDTAAHTVTWTLANQAAGAEGRVALTVRVLDTAKAAGVVNNQAGVKVGNDAEVKTEIIPNPVPNPEKTETSRPGAGGQVFVGDELTYEITWKNYNNETAEVTITDPLDAGVDFVNADNGGAYDRGTHTVTWSFNAAAGAADKVTLTVRVNESAKAAGQVSNQAGVKVGNDAEVKTQTIPNPTPNPKKTEETPGAGRMVQPGDSIMYRITWKNYQSEAANVVVRDPLDAGVNFVSADNNGVYDAATHTVTWTFEAQAAGAEGAVTLVVSVNENAKAAGRVNNQAGVKVGNDAEVTSDIIPNPVPNPHKTEVNPGARIAVEVGQTITYRVSYVNYQSGAANVTITDRLDPGLDYVNGSADNGGVYDAQTRTITWTIANAPAGSEGFVTFQVTVNANASDAGATGAADGIFVPGDFSVLNQASVRIGNDPAVNTEIIENPLVNEEVHYLEGTLTVTKQLLDENGAAVTGNNQTFYAGVFADAAHTVLSDRAERNLIPLTLNGTSTASETVAVSFAPGETLTLYVTEVDANGIPVSEETGSLYTLVLDKMNVTINEENNAGSVLMTNRPYVPEGFYKSGELKITKRLLGADGTGKASSETFYAGIFADAAYTELAGSVSENIVALPLGGKDSVTKTVDVSFGEDETVTLYVTEVTADGTPVENAASFAYDVTVEGSTVTFSSTATESSVTITNQEFEEETEKPSNEPEGPEEPTIEEGGDTSEPVPAGTKAVKTGDETPLGLYLGLLLAAALVLVLAFVLRRRTRKQ